MPKKATRKCQLCKLDKDRTKDFYSPNDRVCKACDPDFKFIKSLRRMVRTNGVVALETRIQDYMRKADMARSVLRKARRKGEI